MKKLNILFYTFVIITVVFSCGVKKTPSTFGRFVGSGAIWVAPKDIKNKVVPWDRYCPPCKLGNALCEKYQCQTKNILPNKDDMAAQVYSDHWVKLANKAALLSVKNGGGPFAAVIVQIDDQSGKVIRYWVNHNAVVSNNDPTAHAEMMTIREAAHDLGVIDLGHINKLKSKLFQPGTWSHCIIYSSSEPCPMCLSAIYWAGIRYLYFSATRFDAAAPGVNFSDKAIYDELKISYKKRKKMIVKQAVSSDSLDAFNYFKRNLVIKYGQAGTQ